MAYKNLNYQKLNAFVTLLFEKCGFTPEESRLITDILLAADLHGIESHGVQRLIRYHNALKAGETLVDAKPELVFETPISAVFDAKGAMGQLISHRAMSLAIEKAKTVGVGMVSVRNSNHYGIAGYYTEMAAKEDLIGVCMTNTEAIMVPTFAKKAMLGTNPIAVSMPADPTPFLFDASTTVVTRGKMEVYTKKEQPIPEGWALDENGQVCTDPARLVYNIINRVGGGILPLGGAGDVTSGYKGYGFALLCELCTAILSGGITSNHKKDINDTCHFFMAVDYGVFGDKKEIRANMSTLLEELRNTPKADGQDRVYIHGEKELESISDKLANGIPVNEKTFAELQMIGEELGVPSAEYIGAEF